MATIQGPIIRNVRVIFVICPVLSNFVSMRRTALQGCLSVLKAQSFDIGEFSGLAIQSDQRQEWIIPADSVRQGRHVPCLRTMMLSPGQYQILTSHDSMLNTLCSFVGHYSAIGILLSSFLMMENLRCQTPALIMIFDPSVLCSNVNPPHQSLTYEDVTSQFIAVL